MAEYPGRSSSRVSVSPIYRTPDRLSKFPAILTRAKRAGREAGALQVH